MQVVQCQLGQMTIPHDLTAMPCAHFLTHRARSLPAVLAQGDAGSAAQGLLNSLGIVAGGGLAGYVFVLNRNKQVGAAEGEGCARPAKEGGAHRLPRACAVCAHDARVCLCVFVCA